MTGKQQTGDLAIFGGPPVFDEALHVGRPNVGKSSFLNALLGTERSIVTDEAGTTRDAIHSYYKMFGKNFILIDTAGVRKKGKVRDDIEFYSVLRSLKALEECDVCIVIIDAERGVEAQDVNLIALAQRQGKGIVLMVNKWDLIEKDTKTSEKIKKAIQEKLAPIDYLPIIFASVINKQRIYQVMEKAVEVYENKFPAMIHNYGLRPDTGGAGKFRGGCGVYREYTVGANGWRRWNARRRPKSRWFTAP